MKGTVFNIQSMCVHDGPGIRTTVFMKGCPLRCKWCHNPEGLTRKVQLRYEKEKCIMCGVCADVCKFGVHSFSEELHHVKYGACTLCGACVEECPAKALDFAGREYSSEEIVVRLSRDAAFWGHDGGVTFSGGEPFLQPDFLIAMLKDAKARGWHTCVDTSGYCEKGVLEQVAQYTDCFLYDIKAFSVETHIGGTGVDNSCILENLCLLGNNHKDIYIRIPLIKEFNCDLDQMVSIAQLLKEVGVKGVTLIPYHILGRSKYAGIGLPLPEVYSAPNREEIDVLKGIFTENGIQIIR